MGTVPTSRRQRGRQESGVSNPYVSWTRSPASTPDCASGEPPQSAPSSLRRRGLHAGARPRRRRAGLDVHQKTVMACARIVSATGVSHHVQVFATTTRDLLGLADWLAGHGCTHVAMESTGVYWKPVWHVLEAQFDLVLANAMHVRNVPGRKTDVNDATWLADLLAHGLIRGRFVPPPAVGELRDLTRTRVQLVRESARHTQRVQKIL